MTNNKWKRGIILVWILFSLSTGVYIVLRMLDSKIVYFLSPTQFLSINSIDEEGNKVRLGGFVMEGSIKKKENCILFKLTDRKNSILVIYNKNEPISKMFREGQSIIVEGNYVNNIFFSKNIIIKHDECYFPKD